MTFDRRPLSCLVVSLFVFQLGLHLFNIYFVSSIFCDANFLKP